MSKLNRNRLRLMLTYRGTFLLMLAAVVLLSTCVQPSYAQISGYATLNGTVTDSTGAVIAGASVTIMNTDTGVKRETVTLSGGDYAATDLPAGHYSVTVSHPGFKTTTQSNITLTTGQVAGVNVTLAIGQANETVQVSSAPEMIETTSAALSDVVNNVEIEELPVDTRNPATFANFAPGSVNGAERTAAMSIAGGGGGMPGEAGTSIDASRVGGVYYELDGVYNMDNYLSSGNPFPNTDATQEFRIISNNFSAEYGGGSTAVVSVVTKSGTNEWHGDAFEFARNQFFNAPDWFSKVKDGYSRNIFGGSEGGPLQRGKQFIFGNVQITKSNQTNSGSASYFPTQAMINNGDFSGAVPPPYGSGCPNASTSPGGGTQLHDWDGTPFPCNVIPNWSSSKVDKVAQAVETHIPQTTNPSGLVYAPGSPTVATTKEFTIKYDWNPSSKDHVMGRVFFDNYFQPPIQNDANWTACSNSWPARNQNYAANWTHTFSPTLINSFTFGYDRVNSSTLSCIDQSWQQLGATFTTPDPNATILVSWGSTGFGWSDQNVTLHRHDFDIGDQVSWSKGKNLVVAGINVMTEYSLEQASWLADPLVNFNGAVTGAFFSDFLLGDVGNFEQGGGEYNLYNSPELAAFGEDTIKLKPNLTLDIGVRWEPWKALAPTPAGREADWWPGHQSTVFPNAPAGLVYPGDAGVPCCGYSDELGRVSPRIGLTWQPKFMPNTSIRAAGGRFSMPYYTTFYNHIGGTVAPFSPTYDLTVQSIPGVRIPVEDPWSVFAGTNFKTPFPTPASFAYKTGAMPPKDTPFALPLSIGAIFSQDFKLGWSQNWNLSIQHEFGGNLLLTAAYVGSEAYHISQGADVNPGIYTTTSAGCGGHPPCGPRTKYPNFQNVDVYEPWGTASYEGLQLSAQKRMSHGLQFSTNWAWSKSLDLLSQSDLSSGPLLRDAYNPRIDRGISQLNVPYVWNTTAVWDLPAVRGHGPLAAGALGNWEVSGLFTMQAGAPFSVVGGANGNDNSFDQDGNDLADRVPGQSLKVHQGSESHWIHQYFNTAAFVPNALGTRGNSPRDVMRGPAYDNLDLAFLKNFPFYHEQYRAQFRWEMYNATNTPWFGSPDGNPTDSTYGQITGPQQAFHQRVMQFALKFYW